MAKHELTTAAEKLSPIQKQAAECMGSPVLVLAGPGSGKTRVLTYRIARILHATAGEKYRILGLTFTNKAADEMRTRVQRLVPGQENRLFLGTFHSFCADVLRQHGIHVGVNPNYNIYSQTVDLQAILNEAVAKATTLSEEVSELDKKTLPVIQKLESLLCTPSDCPNRFSDKAFGERMAVVYECFQKEMAKRNALDFDCLIYKTYELFTKFPALGRRYRMVYSHVCIDEFQDTNHAQYALIRAFTGNDYTNVFAVADDDQIIYQWNGASHQRIQDYVKDYSPKVFQLPVNYRCPPEIVHLANNLIQNNFLRTADKKPLQASRPSQGVGTVRLMNNFRDPGEEAVAILRDIKTYHAHDLGSVVILGRSRRLLEGILTVLQRAGVPAVLSQRKNEFESAPFLWLHSMLRLANDRHNRTYLEAACGSFTQLTQVKVDPNEIVTQAETGNGDYLQHWVKWLRQQRLPNEVKAILEKTSQSLGEGRDFRAFIDCGVSWIDSLSNGAAPGSEDPTAEAFSGYIEELSAWQELMREMEEGLGSQMTLEAFLQELQMHSKEAPPDKNAVVLMTIHAAKGKEFDHVYLCGLVDDELPSYQSKKKGDRSPEMEEERRNCFVAITRTAKTLTLSYADSYWGWPKSPSRFLYEMGILRD